MSHTILQALATGAENPDVRAWAADALRQIANGAPVDAALKLDRGQRVRQRDRHLRDAWQLLAADGAGDWKVAGRLAQAIERHKRMHQRYLSGADIEPGNELDDELHFAFCCGAGMIGSQEKLYEQFKATG